MTFEKVRAIIVDQIGVGEEEVKLETKLVDDLGIDSLEIFEIVMSLEEEFGLEIPNEDVEGITTVDQIVKYVDSKK